MTVPLSEAVANMVPVELIARNDIGALWAWMTLATVFVAVENIRTSPDWVCAVEDDAEVDAGADGEGTVEG
jgi:hypothetical protein